MYVQGRQIMAGAWVVHDFRPNRVKPNGDRRFLPRPVPPTGSPAKG